MFWRFALFIIVNRPAKQPSIACRSKPEVRLEERESQLVVEYKPRTKYEGCPKSKVTRFSLENV
jgi:hypothetical protein